MADAEERELQKKIDKASKKKAEAIVEGNLDKEIQARKEAAKAKTKKREKGIDGLLGL